MHRLTRGENMRAEMIIGIMYTADEHKSCVKCKYREMQDIRPWDDKIRSISVDERPNDTPAEMQFISRKL